MLCLRCLFYLLLCWKFCFTLSKSYFSTLYYFRVFYLIIILIFTFPLFRLSIYLVGHIYIYIILFNLDSIVGSKSSFSQHRSSNCFLDKGKRYRGKMNITKSGKKCVNWNKIPYLNNISFPSLEKNFCRNPEGYGLKPWCYVNTKNRTWEYCEIKACEGKQRCIKNPVKYLRRNLHLRCLTRLRMRFFIFF